MGERTDEMNINEIINIITTVGFPICVCIICFWYIYKQDLRHGEEMQKLSEALNNNTLVMQQLVDKLEVN